MEAREGDLSMGHEGTPGADALPVARGQVPQAGRSPGGGAVEAATTAPVDGPGFEKDEAEQSRPEHVEEEEENRRGGSGAVPRGVEVEEEGVAAVLHEIGREVAPGFVPFTSASATAAAATAAAAEGVDSGAVAAVEDGVPVEGMDYEELSVLASFPASVSDAAAEGKVAAGAADGSVSHAVEVGEGTRDNEMDYEGLPMLAPFPSMPDAVEEEAVAAAVGAPFMVGDLAVEDAQEELPLYENRQEEEERGAEGVDLEDRAVSHRMESEDGGIAVHEIEDAQQFPVLSPLSSDFVAAEEKEEATSLGGRPVVDYEAVVDKDAAEEDEEEEAASTMAVEEELAAAVSNPRNRGGGRKKRGRPPKTPAARLPAKKKEEEDLCFICFDGGNLVVCDRRGCPKVYHPACVNRDESFFRSKGRWNCGWHICSVCEKAAHYMCLTCTYSLCKACVKEAEFVCVRGNKGFCETCRSTVMLIETGEQEKKNMVGVDFDDRNSWMYLFKDYWLDLKRKLSITSEEIARATNPWKGLSAHNEESSDELYDAKEDLGSSSDSSSVRCEGSKPARKKVRRQSKTTLGDEEPVKLAHNEGAPLPEDTEWASMELLEFVAHMRNGDKSVMCQFDVHTLLLEYIKQNKLRDPRRKSQIICDSRLEKLFGKPRVAHFEMLNLLESHFLIKETSQVVTDDNQGGVVDPESNQMDTEGNSEVVPKTGSDKKRRSRRRIEDREPQNNLDDYASIDIHNISLIYLRRNLMEELLDDTDGFNDKVFGSFVRIRISGAGQRQDMYRLVQVIGTGKAAEKYKTGKKTTDITLEILNLSKTEAIPIDSISNQEFTEEECERLRQSIKCGLINRLTVRDVLEKAMALQAVRVNESLENEKLRLTHLRDRASEKGRRKELRECVEKLQLLNSPEECSRRMNDIPEVHADPNMDPNYESAEEESGDKKQDNFTRSTESRSARMGRGMNASLKGNLGSSDSWSGSRRGSTASWESSKNISGRGAWDKIDTSSGSVDRVNEAMLNQEKDLYQANSWDMSKSLATAAVTDAGVLSNGQPGIRPGQPSCLSIETSSTSQCTETTNPSSINENEKMWHYQDPSGKIQGPFSMTQLRKWSTTGYFPANLRIWRTPENQDESILLTDALIGKFQKEPPAVNTLSQFPKGTQVMDVGGSNCKDNWRASNNSWAEKKKDDLTCSETNFSGVGTNLVMAKPDGWVGQSSGWASPSMDPMIPRDGKVGPSSRIWESSKHPNAWSAQPQGHNPPTPSTAPISGNSFQFSAQQGRGRGGNVDRWRGGQSHGNTWGPNRSAVFHSGGHGYGRQHSSNYVQSGQQSPGELWKAQSASNSNYWGNDSLNLPTPTPRPAGGGWIGDHGIGNQSSAPLSVSVQSAASGWAGTAVHAANSLQFPTVSAEQPTSTVQTLTSWGPNPSLPKPTEIGASWDSLTTATMYVAPESTLADGLGASHTPSVQSVPHVSSGQSSSANNSAPDAPPNDEKLETTSGKIDGFVSVSTRDFQDRHMKDDCPSPTPKDEQEKFDALISECSHQHVDSQRKSFEASDAFATGHSIKAVDNGRCDATAASPVAMQTPKYSANRSPESDSVQEKGKIFAVNVTIPEGSISQVIPLESFLKDTNLEVNQSLHFPSSTKIDSSNNENLSTKHPGGSDGLEFQSSQKQVVERPDADYSSQSKVQASDLSERQEADSVALNPAFKGDDLVQGQTQNPREVHAIEPAKPGNLGLPAGRTEWSMPSPTPAIEPCGFRTGAESAFDDIQPASAQLNSGIHLDPGSLSNLYHGSGNNEIKHLGAGLSQENMINAVEPAVGSGQVDLGPAVVGNMSASLGPLLQGNATMAQGNTSAVWATSTQGNTNVNVGWATPAQANANMNMFWVALAQANPSWGNPIPGNANPNVNPNWILNPPMNTQPVSNWGAVTPPVNPNATQNWGPAQGNVNAVSSWPASQGNTNPNTGWFGQGNMNMGYNTPTGNPGNWGSQQKPNTDGYTGHDDRGFQGNDAGHGSGRHGWNRSQSSGGGGLSRAPPRGQRVGICKYHESGHCKKGAHCNYLHT